MALAQLKRAAIARCQRRILTLVSASPNRADGMNHMPRRQPITPGDFGVAGRAAMERAAFGQQVRSCGTMDRAVHAATA